MAQLLVGITLPAWGEPLTPISELFQADKKLENISKFTKLYLCSIPRNYHVSYTNTDANKILLMGGETNPKTGVEIPGKSVLNL